MSKKSDDLYFLTLNDAITESENEIKKYENSDDEMDKIRYNKAVKNNNIIKKQFEIYTNVSMDKKSLSNLNDKLAEYDKIIEKCTQDLKIKIIDIIVVYMSDISNKELETFLNRYKNIVPEDDYEMIYKKKVEEKKIQSELSENKNKSTNSKYGNTVIDKNGEIKKIL